MKKNSPAVYVNSRIVFANTETSGARTSFPYCMPILLGHKKDARGHPPALQVKTRGTTARWGFYFPIVILEPGNKSEHHIIIPTIGIPAKTNFAYKITITIKKYH